ncbi:MAG: DUF6427 family protein [Bacteroidia bacterium]
MFIRFFKSSQPASFIFLPLLALLLWVPAFLKPLPPSALQPVFLYAALAQALQNSAFLSVLIAFLLVIGEAFLLNYIVNKHEIAEKKSQLPAMFYILFMSNSKPMLSLHPILIAHLFILLMLNKLMNSYRKDSAFSDVFDASLLLAVASFFYLPTLVFIPILWISFIIFRPFIWREWVISIFGLLTPFLFLAFFYFWKNDLSVMRTEFVFRPFPSGKPDLKLSFYFYLLAFMFLFVSFLSLSRLAFTISMNKLKTKKAQTLLIWVVVFGLFTLFFAPAVSSVYFAFMSIPAAVFVGNYFLNLKKTAWAEILFLLILASVALNFNF